MTSPSSFASLPLSPPTLENLERLEFHTMTPVQAQSLPLILAGKDVIVQAKTGSGKTAALGLGILHTLNSAWFGTQALVLCPTRELSEQVARELRHLARAAGNIKILTLCGGAAIRPQIESLQHGAHIVVATPGRLLDHIERGSVDLAGLKTLVLDEADRMIDMGFHDDITAIVKACPTRRQTLLFSATYPDNIRKASARFLNRPQEIRLESRHDDSEIEQRFYEVVPAQRNAAVAKLLAHFKPVSTLAFCNTKAQVRTLALDLRKQGFSALALHGDLEQREREDVLVQFSNQSCSVLVATDVAARGLDIQTLDAVINVDITPNAEVHVHRIGRTGRGKSKGLALSLVTRSEMHRAALIETYQGRPIAWFSLDKLKAPTGRPPQAPMVTLCIQGGRKDKLRAGDLVGALTKDAGFAFEQIGKINVLDFVTFIALDRRIAAKASEKLSHGTIKGRHFNMRFMQDDIRL